MHLEDEVKTILCRKWFGEINSLHVVVYIMKLINLFEFFIFAHFFAGHNNVATAGVCEKKWEIIIKIRVYF